MMSKRWLARSLAVAGLVCAVAQARADKPPLRVAVLDFHGAGTTAELEALGVGLQSMITTDLSELPGFVLIERARLRDLQSELKLQQTDAIDKATASKLGGLAGASHLLVGTFTVAGGKMRLDARLFGVADGSVLLTEKAEGPQASFFELEKTLVTKLVATVGVKLGKKERAELAKPETTNFDAFQKFSTALALADQKKGPEAIAAMQAAVAADGSFALAATKLKDLQSMFPPAPPKAEAPQQQCKQNPLTAPQCPSEGGKAPPMPTLLTGGEDHVGLVVRASQHEATCTTPCQLYLAPGPVEVQVKGKSSSFTKQLTIPEGNPPLRVTTRNRTNLIIGSALTGALGLMLIASIVLYVYDKPYDPNTGSSAVSYSQYAPIPLALATGLAYPAIHFLLRIGKDGVQVGGN